MPQATDLELLSPGDCGEPDALSARLRPVGRRHSWRVLSLEDLIGLMFGKGRDKLCCWHDQGRYR